MPKEETEIVTDGVTRHVTSRVTNREITEQNKNKNIDIYNISSNEDIVETSEKNPKFLTANRKNRRKRIGYLMT